MSAAARAGARTGVHRTGAHRTGVHRTGTVRTGTVRSGQRSVPVRPDLRLVPAAPAARARRPAARSRRAPFVLLVLGLLVGTTLALLVLNTAIAVDSLKATALRKQNALRTDQVQALQRQVVQGSTPQRLAARASAAGLVPAGTPGYLVVQPDGTSTLRGTPTPATSPPPPPPPTAAPGQNPAQAPAPAPAAPPNPDAAGD